MEISVKHASEHHQESSGASSGPSGKSKSDKRDPAGGRATRIITVMLLFSVAVLLIAIAFLLYFGGNSEDKYVSNGSIQAVDVNTNGSSEVYFGAIKSLTDKYIVLDNVFYAVTLPNSTTVMPIPLACQSSKPFNRLVINRSNVNWWENLQSDSNVATSITNYNQYNPSGGNCPTIPGGSILGATGITPTPSSTSSSTTKQ